MNVALYPLILNPAYKDYIWGGSRIPSAFNRDLPPGIYAESWELSDRPEGMGTFANGPLQGLSLANALATRGQSILGHAAGGSALPLLVKLIDARERLSIQVHPDNPAAASGLGEAKTEAWHILAAEAGSKVYAGLNPGVTRDAFLDALRNNRLEACLNAVPVKAGDTIFIPGGRVHAIGEGLLLLEVQQNSNTTYRVYDWGRVGHDGKPRELHIEQALNVIRWHDSAPVKTTPQPVMAAPSITMTRLVECPFFRLERLELGKAFEVRHDGAGFHAVFTASGAVAIETEGGAVDVPLGRTCLIPAALNRYTIRPGTIGAKLLRITLP